MSSDRTTGISQPADQDAADPELWVDRHGDALYRYALLRLRSADRAADAVQETFLEALRARASFSGRSAERTWLIGILRHKIVDHYRREAREASAEDSDTLESAAEACFDRRGRWKRAPVAWPADPARAIEAQEFWDVFGRCLSKLPPALAQPFFLREVDEVDSEEIRRDLSLSPANLWTRLHRARLLLRQCLEIHWFGHKTNP